MASLEEFGKRMQFVAGALVANTELALRRAMIAVDQAVVLATPVDTGRARGNWIASIGSPATAADAPVDKTGVGAMNQALGVAAQFKSEQKSMWLCNNVEYILPLDNGSSKQAPNGMTAQGVLVGNKVLADEAKNVYPK